jgi:hypothetical protein
MGANFYEIPILVATDPSRTHMRQVACHMSRVALYACLRGFLNLIRINALVCKRNLVACGAAGAGRSTEMLDIVMLAIGLGFFALSVGYAIACDQL